jgi:hypothetical protein|tara:strand:+ start:1555 stop:1932 length:378 start_codon:yes stop_codon:yes gene_type:complete
MIHPIYQIQEVTFTGVGNTFVELPLEPCPFKGKISRVRAIVTAGTAINEVAYEIRLVPGGTNLEVVAYSLGGLLTQPIDEQSPIKNYFQSASAQGVFGTLFAAVRVDDATADHTVEFQVTFENLV